MTRFFGVAAVAMAVVGFGSQARAQVISYSTGLMTGALESPPNASLGTGTVQVDFNPTAHTLRIFGSFTGLSSNTTAAHFLAPTAVAFTGTTGVATLLPAPPNFPLGVTSGSFDSGALNTLLDSTYNPAFESANGGNAAGAESALAAAMAAGKAYFNIHTVNNGGGEIRGFLVPVPEPSSWALSGLAALGVLKLARRRRAVATPGVDG